MEYLLILEGEVLGIAGVEGNGQSELVEVLTGLRKTEEGRILINGVDASNKSPKEIRNLGIAMCRKIDCQQVYQ